LSIYRVLSVTRYPAAECRGLAENKVRVTSGGSLDPIVLIHTSARSTIDVRAGDLVLDQWRVEESRAAATASSLEWTPSA
jgi:hypothetical protein